MTSKNYEIQGAVWDVDDTLLNNQPDPTDPLSSLHQQSRLAALHHIGKKYDIKALQEVEAQENFDSFARSPVHTVAGALWTVLHDYGLVDDTFNPAHPLILEMLEIKNSTYGKLILTHGVPIEGAPEFVKDFSTHFDIETRNAIASTATFGDIKTFLSIADLEALFPDPRIISVESITRPKPDPEAFDLAFQSLYLPESARPHVFAFEDDPRGMLSARKAGLTVCAITTRYDRAFLEQVEAKPDIIADSYAEFREMFNLPATS